MQSTLREMTVMMGRPRLWMTFAAIVLLFALMGPFGTYIRLDFIERLGYWLVVQAGAWMIALLSISAFVAQLEPRGTHIVLRVIAGSAFAAIPISIFVMAMNQVVFDLPFTLPELARNILFSAPIAVALGIVTWLTVEPRSTLDSNAPQQAPLLQRLPVEKRGGLIRLHVQDHYTQVVTTKGSHLVLLRFSDALKELGAEDGMQVHRSHWVSKSSVIRLDRGNGRLTILTQDGAEVPVSRTFAAAVRQEFGGRNGEP